MVRIRFPPTASLLRADSAAGSKGRSTQILSLCDALVRHPTRSAPDGLGTALHYIYSRRTLGNLCKRRLQ